MQASHLVLKNGLIFNGFAPTGQSGDFFGETVFTTGMTGYPEALTDPSFSGQILTFTYPLIGNYGIPAPQHWESQKMFVNGIIISETCENWSHHQGLHSLVEWAKLQHIPLLMGVDTRALTKVLRMHGTMPGCITNSPQADFKEFHMQDLVKKASISHKQIYGSGKKKIIAVDCGMKENILRSLLQFPVTIERVPFDYDYSQDDYDGLFISNGPGDPMECTRTIQILSKALQKGKPIFGICLGAQLMGLASGAKTYKLGFGHRGQNQPCIDLRSKKCFITSQNHGYAVDETTLPSDWMVTFKNLNDGSVEGIAHKDKPFFAVQFHPEAAPGPTDTQWLFEEFYKCIKS